jgi:hypothetical protein
MTADQLNKWLTLTANFAVVAGIIFLAVEIRQNNVLLLSESRQAAMSNDQTALLAGLNNVDIFEKWMGQEELSATDQYRLSIIFVVDVRNREFEYTQYLNGVLDEQSWLSYRDVLLFNLTTPRGRKWWEKIGRNIPGAEFAAMVDDLLKNAPVNNTMNLLGNWDVE